MSEKTTEDPDSSEKRVIGRPFAPGQSGNPGGRSSVSAALSRLIQANTNNGYDLMLYCLAVLRGEITEEKTIITKVGTAVSVEQGPSIRDRTKCAEILLERMAGKATETHEISGPEGKPIEIMPSNPLLELNADELAEFDKLLSRAAKRLAPGAGQAGRAVIEVQPARSDLASEIVPEGPGSPKV